ncbi:MAG: nucleotidyltransferase domain-containing protein [Candidatus Micrarchaeota archaeon]|nr:nucleotidyltransferase domain-containing protein [Candidatus Micrarchaeota archaeon]
MLGGWASFLGWTVLEWILNHPTTQIHVKELARQLHVSPLTANTYLKAYRNDGILFEEKKGNAQFYQLVDSPVTRHLKSAFTLRILERKAFVRAVLEENPQATSIVLYGTRANGTYDEQSDYDVLVFSQNPAFPKKAVHVLEKEANLRVLGLNQYRKLNEAFRKSIENNHVILYGSGLVNKA